MSRMFGTDGVRGIANTELDARLAYNLGRAGAYVLTEGAHKPKILVGKDTRISGDMLEAALVAGILSVGAEAVVLGVVPTPAVAHLTREYGADAGVMISASHNPVEYNGIKFFDDKGYKLSDELEDEIQRVIESDFEGVPSPVGGAVGRSYTEETALREYIDYAMSTITTDLKGLRVALDCANGAAYKAAVKAFRALGARVYVINDNPDGNNINENCGSTHMEELMDYVVRKNCDIGFAFDGDADRCLAVDEKGNMINGDFLLTICAKALKEAGKLNDDTLVVTVMSNLGLDIAAKREGINLVKTKVGDRYVLEEMLKDNYILGGEQSGHIIFLDHNTTGDGLVTALQIAAILKESGNFGVMLDSIEEYVLALATRFKLDRLPVFETVYLQVGEKINMILSNASTNLVDNMILLGENIVGLAVVPITTYYLLADGHLIYNKLLLVFPTDKRVLIKNINNNIDKILSRYILSQLLLSLIIGALSFVLLLILRVKFPLVLSIINAIANIIPYFGPIIGGVPIIFMAFTGSVTKGLLAAVGVFLIQQVEGNFLAPKITGDSTNMHPIIIIILLILGEKMGGVIGMVLSVPIAVIIKVVYDDIDYYLF